MKKNLIGVVDLKPMLKCEQAVLIEYYITKAEEDDEEYNSRKPYGIEVIKKQKIDGVVYREIKTVNDISGDRKYVENLLKTLYKNTVTPITVGDVLEDLTECTEQNNLVYQA